MLVLFSNFYIKTYKAKVAAAKARNSQANGDAKYKNGVNGTANGEAINGKTNGHITKKQI